MTFRDDEPVTPPRPMQTPRKRSPLAIAVAVVAALVIAGVATANVWTEAVWYQHLGFFQVWSTEWLTRLVLFAVAAVIAGLAVWLSLWLARRARPPRAPGQRTLVDGYRDQIAPIERVAMWALPVAVGLISGAIIAGDWMTVLTWWHQQPFGVTDPQFGFDLSFFVFTLPAIDLLIGFVLGVLIVCALLSTFVHLLFGSITTGGRSFVTTRRARTQLAVIGALIMIVIAVRTWFSRYTLLTQQGDRFDGANYADVNAVLPARGIIAGIAIIVAIMFLVVIARADWRIPAAGVALMVLSSLVVGSAYPAIVQRFQVGPNEQQLEAPFIQRHIDATLESYGLDEVEITPYDAETLAQAGALRADAQTTASIRLLDPNVVAPAFQQLQQNKQYYNFPDSLNVDRYVIDGETRDTVIAVRELNLDGLSAENRTWINDHTVFTHGFGVVAAFGNTTNEDGQPTFYEGGIPPVGELGDYEPRIYFGRNVPDYSIVGAPEGTTPWELDFPDDSSPTGQVNTTYAGDGGPSIGSFFARLAYSVKFGEEQILFSDRVTSESQVLYYRDPLERVARVAPYLRLDGETYPAVVDGRVVWVVDGYTVSDRYPYADRIEIGTVTNSYQMSYIRNSVKATVDAYSGEVTLYAWDAEDPILATWMEIFPDSVTGVEEITSETMSHFRYPEYLFRVQRAQLATYHVTDAESFYSGQDFWRNPQDPTSNVDRSQPPYYLSLQMPGQDQPTFSLTSTFIPGGNSDRNVLTGFLAVNSEPGATAGVIDDDYGQLRLLELPRDSTVPGPGQVQNNFNSNPDAQNVLNLLRQGDSDVVSGNLLTLPVGGGLLYVQPVYVQSSSTSGGTQFPYLRKVFVAFGESVGFADTLDEALDQVFGSSVDPEPSDPTDPTEPTDPSDPVVSPEVSEARAALQRALAAAQAAIAAGEQALADGDFAAYGDAQDDLADAIERAIAAEEQIEEAIAATEEELAEADAEA